MTDLLNRVCVPVATPDDARRTCLALREYDPGYVIAVHIIEKAGGAIDKASVEQREERAEKIFAAVEDCLPGQTVETDLRYGTEVTQAIFEAGAEHDASAIVFTPRGGSRWVRLLTGDVALDLVTGTDRPVIVLPDQQRED